MNPRRPLVVALTLTTLAIAACTTDSDIVKHDDKSIGQLSTDKQSKLKDFMVEKGISPGAADPELVLDNYRKILEVQDIDPAIRAEVERRIADVQVQMADARGNTDPQSVKQLQDSISTYESLMKETPSGPDTDDVLYQLARAYENSGQNGKAIDTLTLLTTKYPKSQFAPDAHSLLAELLYRSKDYEAAEAEYLRVIAYGSEGPFYEPAMQKYAWSLYKQSKYEEAITACLKLLTRLLPSDASDDPVKALAQIPATKTDLGKDAMYVANLSFSQQGTARPVNDYFAKHAEPAFSPLIYHSLGVYYIEKKRYADAANIYSDFIAKHPASPQAPQFQSAVIDADEKGGFEDLIVREKERYANSYEPTAPYWGGKAPPEPVMVELRKHFEDLARYYNALAQKDPKANHADFLVAAKWYRKVIQYFPKDPKTPELNYLLADALLDGGETRAAAIEYENTAYGYPANPHSGDAAFAAVQAYQKLATEVPPEKKADVLRLAASSALKLANNFKDHPKRQIALAKAAEDLQSIGDRKQAIDIASIQLTSNPPPSPEIRRAALAIVADSNFELGNYAAAEPAYGQLTKLVPAEDPTHKAAVDRLGASIYKQGEAARSAGDMKSAAAAFMRVSESAPTSAAASNAEYDAGSALFQTGSFAESEKVFESFRSRYPESPLISDTDKKLAVAYQRDHKPVQAAGVYQRIAGDTKQTPEIRRTAALLVAQMYEEAKQPAETAKAYQAYVEAFPQPLDEAMDARKWLADHALANHDSERRNYWEQQIIAADAGAGAQRDQKSKALAAQATLEFGREATKTALEVRLTMPLDVSLAEKKTSVEKAIALLNKAISFGFADVVTESTYHLGELYQNFGRSLMDSPRPGELSKDQLEQYDTMLEEQADPFEEKAISAYEINLKRVDSGLYDEWIGKSVAALGELSPAKYGKRELTESSYDSMR